MSNSQEQDEQIWRKKRELEKELADIELQEKPLYDWNTEKEEQIQKEIESLSLKLDKLNTNQD